ncbi:MAG TPA: hypothetical protein VK285_00790 [Gaiellaceae bacterium]|nr:hypothetical protein [Gaiellaceae bacterium]
MADRGKADPKPGCERFETQALAGRELEASDFLAESAVDTVLDGRDLERS